MMRLPEDIAEKIYDVLVAHTGAPEQYRHAFMYTFTVPEEPMHKPTEFRVCSKWGMAGKFWWANNKFYVSGRSRCECSTDRDYEMEAAECDKVNELLAPIYEEFEQLENYHD
jgi:hypothetical protein